MKLDQTNRPEVEEGLAYADAAKHDFTAPRKRNATESLNDVVIAQVGVKMLHYSKPSL